MLPPQTRTPFKYKTGARNVAAQISAGNWTNHNIGGICNNIMTTDGQLIPCAGQVGEDKRKILEGSSRFL